MTSFNKVILIGNCGRDPEMRYLPTGQAVVNVTLATTSGRNLNITDSKADDIQWHRLTFFGSLAQIATEYLEKGLTIYVEGRLKYGNYKGRDGLDKSVADILVTDLQLIGLELTSYEVNATKNFQSTFDLSSAPDRNNKKVLK